MRDPDGLARAIEAIGSPFCVELAASLRARRACHVGGDCRMQATPESASMPPLPPTETPRERWNGLVLRGIRAAKDKAAGVEGAAEEFEVLREEAAEVRALLEAELGRPLTLDEQARGVR